MALHGFKKNINYYLKKIIIADYHRLVEAGIIFNEIPLSNQYNFKQNISL